MSSASSSSASSSDSGSGDSEEQKNKKKEKKSEKKEELVVSSGSESSDSGSDSSEESDKKKKKKQKKDKKEKKGKKKQKQEKKKKVKKKDKKKEKKVKAGKGAKGKKGKKDKKKGKAGERDAVSNQFGKYGVIKAEDFFNKKPEFLSWSMEVKKVNTDMLGQMQMKDLFKEYIEDFNTATMPSEKYYDLHAWDAKMSLKRQKKNRNDDMDDAQRASLASFDDESARRHEIKALQAKKAEQQLTNEVKKLRADNKKVEEMRKQDFLRNQLELTYKSGNIKEADKMRDKM